MVAQDVNQNERHQISDHEVSIDRRVQHEFQELNTLLEHIADIPLNETPASVDPNWRIEDPEVTRWLITLEGKVNLERIARFRRSLLSEDDVVDAQIVSLELGQIHIRVITNGGLPMGPLEHAVGKLTARSMPADT